jgi:hypothetical protein
MVKKESPAIDGWAFKLDNVCYIFLFSVMNP